MRFEPKRPIRISDSQILQEIRRVVSECGGVVPTPKEFSRLSKVNIATVKDRFGSYQQALSRGGFIYTPPSAKYTAENVEADLRSVLTRTGGYRFSRRRIQTKRRLLQHQDREIHSRQGWLGRSDGRDRREAAREEATTYRGAEPTLPSGERNWRPFRTTPYSTKSTKSGRQKDDARLKARSYRKARSGEMSTDATSAHG